jgi:transposase
MATLVQHGLLKARYIPSAPQRALRDVTRSRVRLTEERAREINRVQKTLEDTTLTLGEVVSDVMGKASRIILNALADGETDPVRRAGFAGGRVQVSQEQLEAALTGPVDDHRRFLVREHLTHMEQLDRAVERITAEIGRRFTPPPSPEEELSPHEEGQSLQAQALSGEPELPCRPRVMLSWGEAAVLMARIPGISERAASGIVAEIGTSRQQFPSAGHLASWAGVCPGNNESAGKRMSGKTRKGNPWLRRLLVQAAHTASRQKKGSVAAQYRRIAARRGKKRAAMVVAHTLLGILYHLLRNRTTSKDRGETFFEGRDQQATEKRLVGQLTRLGSHVELQPIAQAG